jgi:hypothetical protein
VDDIVRELSYDLVPQSLVQTMCFSIERGDAHEHVGIFGQDASLSECDQLCAESLTPAVGLDGDALDVPDKSADHTEDEKAGYAALVVRNVDLASRVSEQCQG